MWAGPLRLPGSVVGLLIRHWWTPQAGHTADPPWFWLSSRSARRRDRWARLGRDFGKSWVQDFESRLGVIVEPGLGRVRMAWRRTSRTGLGGSSSARGIVAPSSRSGMTGTLRSGAEMVPSDSAITARLSSLLMPCPSEAQKQTEEARCRRQQESSWRLTELVGPGSETIAASACAACRRRGRFERTSCPRGLPSVVSKRCCCCLANRL